MDFDDRRVQSYRAKSSGLSLAETVRLPATRGDGSRPNTKIVCTMGPACWDVDNLTRMMELGMSICRLNFSHGDHETHGATVARIREAAAAVPGKEIAILLDTKGPEIRTGFLGTPDKKVSLTAGQTLRLTTDYEFVGDSTCIACSYKKLPTSVSPGNTILIADGSLVATVLECGEDFVDVRVENNAKIGERKNMNLPGVKVDLPVLQPKDIHDIQEFGIPQGVDFVAASFVQSKADVVFIREILGEAGKNIKIISKIENQEGLENFDEILLASDGIMVARGDLGMEIPPHQVFIAQKMMISRCNVVGKPVITATQMLESMTGNPRPTRAEVSDVANAVLDGTDAVMLSGETAGGSFPLKAVATMAATCLEAEKIENHEELFSAKRARTIADTGAMALTESIASSAVKTALEASAAAIITAGFDNTNIVSLISKYCPPMPVYVATADPTLARQVSGSIKSAIAVRIPADSAAPVDACCASLTSLQGSIAVVVENVSTAGPQIRFKTL